jgi:hypothetical protein
MSTAAAIITANQPVYRTVEAPGCECSSRPKVGSNRHRRDAAGGHKAPGPVISSRREVCRMMTSLQMNGNRIDCHFIILRVPRPSDQSALRSPY